MLQDKYFKYIEDNPDKANPETFIEFVKQEHPSLEEAFVAFVNVRNHYVLDEGHSAIDWDVKDAKEKLAEICGDGE